MHFVTVHFSVDDKTKQFIHEIYTKHVDEFTYDPRIEPLQPFLKSCDQTYQIMQVLYQAMLKNPEWVALWLPTNHAALCLIRI